MALEQSLIVTYCFSYNYKQIDARREAEIAHSTAVEWYKQCRSIPELWLQANPMIIGGVDRNGQPIVVEVDESKFFKRKYNRGRRVPGMWVFGGIERVSGKCFLVAVAQRDAATLEALLVRFVRPGSRIISDGWRGYNNVANIPGQNYVHDVVIHERNFVDPNDRSIHTQNCENMWMKVKNFLRERHGVHSERFFEAMNEWIWRNYCRVQALARPGRDLFEEFLVCVGDLY